MLNINSQAQELHAKGIDLMMKSNFIEAHDSYATALDILQELPRQSTDIQVQTARVMRDDGFAFVREALHSQTPDEYLAQGSSLLRESLEMTGTLVVGLNPLELEDIEAQPNHTPKEARREIFAEHGATLSMLGRLATVHDVMIGKNTTGDSEAANALRMNEQQSYGLAHDWLRIGSNGYYKVSNAMAGARQERINDRTLHTGRWIQRAVGALSWTAARDTKNLKAATRSFASRSLDLHSPGTAILSVHKRP